MTPGTLGELIAPNGQTDHYAWESWAEQTNIYRIDGMKIPLVAVIYGPEGLRLERVAALVGYLEDELRADV